MIKNDIKWICKKCKHHNFKHNHFCKKCYCDEKGVEFVFTEIVCNNCFKIKLKKDDLCLSCKH